MFWVQFLVKSLHLFGNFFRFQFVENYECFNRVWDGDPMWPIPMIHWNSLHSDSSLFPASGHNWRLVQTCSSQDLPYWHLVDTETYILKAGGKHPTGTLSCFWMLCGYLLARLFWTRFEKYIHNWKDYPNFKLQHSRFTQMKEIQPVLKTIHEQSE